MAILSLSSHERCLYVFFITLRIPPYPKRCTSLLNRGFQYEARFKEKWHEVVRYDCAHGFFHRDIMHPNGEKTKYHIPIANLNNALLYAEQDIKDRWKWYRDIFKKEMK